MPIQDNYLELLACPACKGALNPQTEPEALSCEPCRLDFPVEQGIPVLLIERAQERGA